MGRQDKCGAGIGQCDGLVDATTQRVQKLWVRAPRRCLDDLGVMRRSLLNAVDDLRQRARILDTRAWALAAAAGAGAAVPVR